MKIEQGPQKPLDKAEAHEEANMMRVELEENEKPRTAEEYDEALAVVEEIKKMAEQEPTTEKILFKLARLATKSAYGVQKCLTCMSTLPDAFIATGSLREEEKETLKKFDDAASELRKLKAEAKKIGKSADEIVEDRENELG